MKVHLRKGPRKRRVLHYVGLLQQNAAGVAAHPHLLKFGYCEEINPLNPELNPICCLLALLGANHFLHVSRIKVKSLTLRLIMSYIYIYIYIYVCMYVCIWSTHS